MNEPTGTPNWRPTTASTAAIGADMPGRGSAAGSGAAGGGSELSRGRVIDGGGRIARSRSMRMRSRMILRARALTAFVVVIAVAIANGIVTGRGTEGDRGGVMTSVVMRELPR
jgi:hypothetical protein